MEKYLIQKLHWTSIIMLLNIKGIKRYTFLHNPNIQAAPHSVMLECSVLKILVPLRDSKERHRCELFWELEDKRSSRTGLIKFLIIVKNANIYIQESKLNAI